MLFNLVRHWLGHVSDVKFTDKQFVMASPKLERIDHHKHHHPHHHHESWSYMINQLLLSRKLLPKVSRSWEFKNLLQNAKILICKVQPFFKVSYLHIQRSYRRVWFWFENAPEEMLFYGAKFRLNSLSGSGVTKKFCSGRRSGVHLKA